MYIERVPRRGVPTKHQINKVYTERKRKGVRVWGRGEERRGGEGRGEAEVRGGGAHRPLLGSMPLSSVCKSRDLTPLCPVNGDLSTVDDDSI